jgi:hypothetical protein
LRHFFRRSVPPFTRVLLVESGSRGLFDHLVPGLYELYGDQLELDLLTCFAGEPKGFRGTVYRTTDYPSAESRKRLLAELRARKHAILGIICSAEPIMTKWKWAMAARIPAKTFVLNENGDYLWLDWGHLRVILHFMLFRAGMTGAAAVPTIIRLVFFPVSLTYLLLYAGFVHLRRKIRLLITSS